MEKERFIMKKGKFLALAIMVAIMLMGAGYAYWSEKVVMNNTVKTGELDVEFVEKEKKGLWDWTYYPKVEINDDLHDLGLSEQTRRNGAPVAVSASISENKKTVNVTVANMYPGAGFTVKNKLENTGTIHAKVTDIKFSWNDDKFAQNLLLKKIKIGNETITLQTPIPLYVLNRNDSPVANLQVQLLKGEKIDIEYYFEINRNATEDEINENRGMSNPYTFSIEAIVRQLNDRYDGTIKYNK